MKLIIDAKSLKTKLKIMNMAKVRGSSKTNMQIAIFLAYIESLYSGKPVELDIGFKLVDVSDIIGE